MVSIDLHIVALAVRPLFCILWVMPGFSVALVFIIVVLSQGSAWAQPDCPKRQAYGLLRQDEDYQYLHDRSCREDFWDPVKYVRLKADGSRYLTVGGEIRGWYERFHNANWGAGPQDANGYFLQRITLYNDFHLGARIRWFQQLTSDLEAGRNGGPRQPIDEARFWIEQGFAEISLAHSRPKQLALRVGRQEFQFGDGSIVDIRNGTNVRQAFDGLYIALKVPSWKVDAIVTRPVRNNLRVFNDPPDHTTLFWGAYASTPKLICAGNVDLFYLGFDRKQAEFEKGRAREFRHTIGARVWGKRKGWNYNWIAAYQWGTFGHDNIRAWEIVASTGHTLPAFPLRPRIGLNLASSSGDAGLDSRTLGTFNMFPSGIVFGEGSVNLNGPINFIQIGPTFGMQLSKRLLFVGDYDFFWRESLGDGVYGLGVNLLRDGRSNGARYLGSQPSVGLYWQTNMHLSTSVTYAHFAVGPFLANIQPAAKDMDYLAGWVTYRF